MTMRPNEIKPDELELLLNEAERGVAGQLLRAAGESIEARPQFAQELETRLVASASSRSQATPQPQYVRTDVMGRLRASSGGEGGRKVGRIFPLALGGLGVAAMVLLLVAMAAMLNLRQKSVISATPNYTCGAWSVVSSPNVDTVNQLTSVAAISNDDVWAVGYQIGGNPSGASVTASPNPDATLILHWDGKSWRAVPSPNVGEGMLYNRLFSVSAVSANDVWAVGYYSDVDTANWWEAKIEKALVLHWDGKEWKEVSDLPIKSNVNSLATVAALAPDDVWVGGYYAEQSGRSQSTSDRHALIMHWDGKAWTQITNPAIASLNGWVYSLEAVAQDDIWAVGLVGINPDPGSTRPFMLHWDGTTWEQTDTPSSSVGSLVIKNMAASSKDDVWAVGADQFESSNAVHARMSHWDGKRWTDIWSVPTGTENGTSPPAFLYDVVAPAPDAVWAVGFYSPEGVGDANPSSTTLLHWNGKELSYVQSPSPDMTAGAGHQTTPEKKTSFLSSIAAVPGGDLWAVGASWGDQGGNTLIMRYSPGPCITPTAVASPTPTSLPPTLVPPVAAYTTPYIGATMPDFASVDVRTGQHITVASLRGKPLVLTFWGAWCPPCKEELSVLQKAYETYGRDVQFLNVSMQPRDKIETVRDFVTQNGYTWRFSHAETNSSANSLVSAMPMTFFQDKDGTVLAMHTGKKSAEQLEGYMRQLGAAPLSTPFVPTAQPTTAPVVPTNVPVSTPDCGLAWRTVPSHSEGTLKSVAAISANDVWAVGYTADSPAKTLVQHWDGKDWSTIPSPNFGNNDNTLNGVAALSPNDVWAVGYYGNTHDSKTLTMHWDGTIWKRVASPDTGNGANQLLAIAAIASDDIWAVGMYTICNDSPCTPHTLTIHWDGKTWQIVPSPNPSWTAASEGTSLSAVAAISDNDVWAVGRYTDKTGSGANLHPINKPLFLHWDGKTWGQVLGPDIEGYGISVSAITAISANDVWAVGSYWSGDAEVDYISVHWDGRAWTENPAPRLKGGTGGGWNAIAATSQEDVWVAGWYPSSRHWNGKDWKWSADADADGSLPKGIVYGMSGVSDDIWSVGGWGHNMQTAQDKSALIVHYSNISCSTP